jgi:hypothetical protein
MSFEELLPILLGILWVVIIPIIRSNNRNKAKSKPVAGNFTPVQEEEDPAEKPRSEEDFFKELFGIPKEPEPAFSEPPAEKPIDEILNSRFEKPLDSIPKEEGSSAFEHEKSVKSAATFAEDKETIYKGVGGNVKANIRQAVIFSEILRRPYAD